MEIKDNIKLVEVYAGELWQATMIQNILEDNEIQAFLENELMSAIAPWRVAAGGFESAKVVVSSLDLEQAKKLIEEFNNSESLEEEE